MSTSPSKPPPAPPKPPKPGNPGPPAPGLAPAASAWRKAAWPRRVVGGALVRVAQDGVGLGGSLELFRRFRPGVAVGVPAHRLLAVGGLDRPLVSVLGTPRRA